MAVPGRQGLTAAGAAGAAAATAPPLPARLPSRRRVNPWVVRAVAFACLLAAWQLASTYVPGAALLLPAPLRIVSVYVDLLRSGELFVHSAASLGRVLAGTAIAAVVALPLGVLIGWFPTFGYAADVVVEMLRPIPPIAWIPLSILWFGIGSGAAVFIIVVGAFFPLLLNTVLGVKGVPRGLLEAARVLGVRRRDQLFWKVVLPAALPAIITGVFLAVGRIAGETAPLILTARGSQFMPRSPSEPTPFLPLYIYDFAKYAPGSEEIRLAWAAAFVLVVVILLLNVGVRLVAGKRVVAAARAD